MRWECAFRDLGGLVDAAESRDMPRIVTVSSDPAFLIILAVALGFATDVVLHPERYRRRRRRDSVRVLHGLVGHDGDVVEGLIIAEVERGATSRQRAAHAAIERLRRDRRR